MEIKWKKVVAIAVTRDDFRAKLVNDPIAVLSEYGLTIPEGTQAKTDAEKEVGILLPPNPSKELEEEVRWWRWRLNMIRSFGREETKKRPFESIPDNTDEDV